jgi:hypothetical protein
MSNDVKWLIMGFAAILLVIYFSSPMSLVI